MTKSNLRTEHRPGSQLDVDAAHDYKSDKVEDVVDPQVVPYHKPHERVRNDETDTFFRDEEHKDMEDAQRQGNALDRFKATMKSERERTEREVKGDLLSKLPTEEVEDKPKKKAAKRTSVAKKSPAKKAAEKTVKSAKETVKKVDSNAANHKR